MTMDGLLQSDTMSSEKLHSWIPVLQSNNNAIQQVSNAVLIMFVLSLF